MPSLNEWEQKIQAPGADLSLEGAVLAELQHVCRSNEEILRHLRRLNDGRADRWECWLVQLTRLLKRLWPWFPVYPETQVNRPDLDSARKSLGEDDDSRSS